MALDEPAGVVGLGDSVVAGPVFRRRVTAFVVERVIVVVAALTGFPVIETEMFFRRNEGQPPAIVAVGTAVNVPFADVSGAVTGVAKRFTQGGPVGFQFHVIDDDAVGERVLTGEQAAALRTADGAAGNGVGEVDALFFETIEHWRSDIGVAVVADGLCAPFITLHEEQVGSPGWLGLRDGR